MFNYDNIGEKIKGLAKWTFIVGAIGAILSGIAMLFSGGWFVILGFLTAFVGSVIAWVSSWLLYGIGEIVDASSTYIHNSRNSVGSKQNYYQNNNSTIGLNIAPARVKDTRCAYCGKNLPANATFCEHCGEFVPNNTATVKKTATPAAYKRCPECGEIVKSGICEMCGKPNNLFE